MNKIGQRAILAELLRTLLLLSLTLFLGQGVILADNVKVITDIPQWQHPVKAVLIKFKVRIDKVELQENTNYPVFYVKFPYDPMLGHNDNYFKPLYYETLKANGFWDYAFIDNEGNCRINIKWDKKTKTLTEDIINLQK